MATNNETKRVLDAVYNPAMKKISAQNAAQTGADTWRDSRTTRPTSPAVLAERARNAELERQKELEQAAQEQAQADLAAYHDDKLQAWVQAGGTAREFDKAWPQIREQYLLKKIGLGE